MNFKLYKKQNYDKVMFLHNVTQSLKYNLLQIERDSNYLYSEISDNIDSTPIEERCYTTLMREHKIKRIIIKRCHAVFCHSVAFDL